MAILTSDKFLNKGGLNNEIPFFICPFAPIIAHEMNEVVINITKQISSMGRSVLTLDLYEISLDLLAKRGMLDTILESEKTLPKEKLKEGLQQMLDTRGILLPEISEKFNSSQFDIVFLTGIGEVFPYIRSHNILNNLQSIIKDTPVVLFFPGEYKFNEIEGSSLSLFGRLIDDKYYRAFDITKQTV